MSLINQVAGQAVQADRSSWRYQDYRKALDSVDLATREEQAQENFGGPNHNDQWIATGDILTLSQGAEYCPASQTIGQCQGYLQFLAALPEKPNAANLAATVETVIAKGPDFGADKKAYITAVALAGANVAAQFATEQTLQALRSLKS